MAPLTLSLPLEVRRFPPAAATEVPRQPLLGPVRRKGGDEDVEAMSLDVGTEE